MNRASIDAKSLARTRAGDRPWGLEVDSKGNIYTSLLALIGEVVVLRMTVPTITSLGASKEESGKDLIGFAGLDKPGNIYVGVKAHSKYEEEDSTNPFHSACRDATATRTWIYKIDAKTRQVTALATQADGWPFCFPHDLAVDSNGNL
jgi:hypothetical protein